MAIPITIITGFLGSGKTTLILNLIPQLPKSYRLALLKNEFGDVAIDSQLASSAAISGVQELLNGCICCNLVGQLGDALETLRKDVKPDRIVIETSGSALPTTLVLEVNRLIRETGHYTLDGVISVIDVQNWAGYEDTSYTARIQARHTDLIIANKWELVDERAYDICLDRIGDLEVQTPIVKSDKGKVSRDIIFGIDGSLAKAIDDNGASAEYDHNEGKHSSEVDVMSCTIRNEDGIQGYVDIDALEKLLRSASREEIYRIKGKVFATRTPASSDNLMTTNDAESEGLYLLNWAFGRWTFTKAQPVDEDKGYALRMTIITARYESKKWKKKLEAGELLRLEGGDTEALKVEKIL